MIMRERAFGPLVGPSALCDGRTFGPSRSATRLQNIQFEIPTKIHFLDIQKKMAAKFDIFGDRHKRYFGRVEKVHFWKIQFQNLL